MKSALLYVIEAAEKGPEVRLANLVEAACHGMGTKDERLIWRVVRGHWDRQFWDATKRAYMAAYGQSMQARVRGDTSGNYQVSWREGEWAVRERGKMEEERRRRKVKRGDALTELTSIYFSLRVRTETDGRHHWAIDRSLFCFPLPSRSLAIYTSLSC